MPTSKDIIEVINGDRDKLSRAFGRIAGFLSGDPETFIQKPIRELAETIEVSGPTLIRFSRHYGFAGFPELRLAVAVSLAARDIERSASLEPSFSEKETVNREAKQAIARATRSLVDADSAILLDSGSTVKFLAEELATASPLTIMTTSIYTLTTLASSTQHVLLLPGGVLRPGAMSLSGRIPEDTLSGLSFSTVFLSADSIDPDFGLSTFSEEEARLNRAMIRASRRVVVLADASKFKTPALHKICDLSQMDILVSDVGLSSDLQKVIPEMGLKLILADPLTFRANLERE